MFSEPRLLSPLCRISLQTLSCLSGCEDDGASDDDGVTIIEMARMSLFCHILNFQIVSILTFTEETLL